MLGLGGGEERLECRGKGGGGGEGGGSEMGGRGNRGAGVRDERRTGGELGNGRWRVSVLPFEERESMGLGWLDGWRKPCIDLF